MQASLITVNREFCHALVEGERVFIHQSECDFRIEEARINDVVEITEIQQHPKGLRGRQVRWVERPPEEYVTGSVVHIGQSFAFIRPDGSTTIGTNTSKTDVMVHLSGFGDFDGHTSPTFNALTRGDRLTGVVHATERGKRAEQVWPA